MSQPAGAVVDPERRAALNAAKLAAAARSHFGEAARERHPYATGAALTERRDGRLVAYVLADGEQRRSLGPALVWADRVAADELHLLVGPSVAGAIARAAREFVEPPTVWAVDDAGALTAAVAEPALVAPTPTGADELVDLLLDVGVEVVVEDGVLRGEINGLEVARVVSGENGPMLEVGVGRADRELTAMLHGELAPVDQLARVVEIVREHRNADAPRHPLNQLAPERWLRARLCADPGRVGLAHLAPTDTPTPRPNLRATWVAPARGETAAGEAVVVVCSVGIDLDLVPAAADARAAVDPEAQLLLVVPERDDHPVTRALVARLHRPAEVVALAGDWRR